MHNERDITVPAMGNHPHLAGTLCVPNGQVAAAAVLIPGSGPQDRDETFFGHPIFQILAHALAEHSIATLRLDDRGEGDSGGDYLESTAQDIIDDAIRAVQFLREQLPGSCHRFGLIGHSQGCLIGMEASSVTDAADFLVLLAGSVDSGRDTLLQQQRDILESQGHPTTLVEAHLAFMQGLFDIVAGHDAPADAESHIRRWVHEHLDHLRRLEEWGEMTDDDIALYIVNDALEWEVRFLLASDPMSIVPKLATPILAMCGEHDVHVRAKETLARLQAASAPNHGRPIATRIIPSANHIFQKCTRATSFEYRMLPSPEMLKPAGLISEWIRSIQN